MDRRDPIPPTPDPRRRPAVPVLTGPPVQGAMEAILRAGQWPTDEYGRRRYVYRTDGRETTRIVYQVVLPPNGGDETIQAASEELAERILSDLGADAAALHRAISAWVALVPEGRDAVIDREQVYAVLGLDARTDLSRAEKDRRCWAAIRQLQHIGLAVVHLTFHGKAVQYDTLLDRMWDIAIRGYGQRRLPVADDGDQPTPVEEYDEWQLLVRPGRWGQRWVWGPMRQVGYMPRAALADPDRARWPWSLALESLLVHRARVSGADRVRVSVREIIEAVGADPSPDRRRQGAMRQQVLAAIESVAEHGWTPDYSEWPPYLRPDAGLDAADRAVLHGDGAGAAPSRMPRGWWDEFLGANIWFRVPEDVVAANQAARRAPPSTSRPDSRQRQPQDDLSPEDLRRVRERHGWSQAQLAAMLGISQSMLSRMEAGTRRIPRQVAEALRRVARDGDTYVEHAWVPWPLAAAAAVVWWFLWRGG